MFIGGCLKKRKMKRKFTKRDKFVGKKVIISAHGITCIVRINNEYEQVGVTS